MDFRRRPSAASGKEAALQEAFDRLEDSESAEAKGTASHPEVTGPRADTQGVVEEKNVEAACVFISPAEPLKVSPFSSPKALAEAELMRARPRDLDERDSGWEILWWMEFRERLQ